ncbi:hypothetical protein G9A89_018095 [Geosiphon pyriformis]|nr:hypothetical protein G9A89_018095 [Geosiphon pyriformis]
MHRALIVEHSIEDSLPGGIPAIKLRKKLTKLWFWKAMNKTIIIESLYKIFRYQTFRLLTTRIALNTRLQRTSTNKHHPKVAESENIGANHLGFAKFLFQHYCQHLGLNYNHISAKSVFNFYVNEKISFLLETPMNTESARETFYRELIQNTNLPTNHNFASIITEINKEIEHHTQQRYPITYASKGKGKPQTPVVISKKIQPPTWKKTKVESPTAPSYHYTPGSAINIILASMSTSNTISTFEQFSFQRIRLLPPQPDFGTTTLWELSEEKEEEESEDQEFTYQNPILKNPEFGTPNVQTHTAKSKTRIIVINQPPVEPIGQPIQIPNQQTQQPPPVPPQQQQQLPPQQQQQMAYAPIVKLDKFTSKEDNAQVWLNDVEKAITANRWNDTRAMQAIPYFLKDTADLLYQSLVNKSQDFNAFKLEFLRYFSNNNSINRLVNTFTTIKQGETETVTTYLRHFHRNLSILQHICSLHPATLQDAVIHARNFESAKLEANHAYTVNLVMNGSSELNSKLKQFRNTNHFQNQLCLLSSSAALNQLWQSEMHICHNCGKQEHIRADCRFYSNNSRSGNQYQNLNCRFQTPNCYPNQDQTTYLPIIQSPIYQPPVYQFQIYQPQPPIIYQPQPQIIYQPQSIQTPSQNSVNMTSGHPRPRITQNWRLAMVVHQLIPSFSNLLSELCSRNSGTGATQNPNSQNYLSLLVTPEDATNTNSGSNQQLTFTSNISPATVIEDESLTAIFPFEIEELSGVLLFSRAAIEEKPIMTMYTDAKINGHSIKLILNSRQVNCAASTRIITANEATKTPIGEIDEFLFEVNGIITPIKVLIMEATQYQALVDNDWLSKTNAVLD